MPTILIRYSELHIDGAEPVEKSQMLLYNFREARLDRVHSTFVSFSSILVVNAAKPMMSITYTQYLRA